MLTIVAGWDPREVVGYNLFVFSAIRRTSRPLKFVPLVEQSLRFSGLYRRPHEQRGAQLWDVISDAPMATSFACSRFLTPWLAGDTDFALFCDGADMMFLRDPAELFALADRRYAVQVVKRQHVPAESEKMDGQRQTTYPRKNWSSVILWNLKHRAHRKLTAERVNQWPGRKLHAFGWLEDGQIGDLPLEWNHLVGVDRDGQRDPALLHWTNGTPETGVKSGEWGSAWLQELRIMDATRPAIRS
jgi:hypothetical protein